MPPAGSKTSLRKHLEKVHKQTGKKPKQLELPTFPDELEYIWGWFCEIRSLSCDGLQFSELKAWSDLRGVSLSDFEFECIQKLNTLLNEKLNERRNSKSSS